jgi:hypothetical protein
MQDDPDAAEVKALLLRHIAVIEAALARIAELHAPGYAPERPWIQLN